MEKSYVTDARFSQYNFEDSFVLGLNFSDGILKIRTDLALTLAHPEYRKPKDGDARCYKRGEITFSEVSNIEILTLDIDPSSDADGLCDLGAIYDIQEVRPLNFKVWAELGSMVVQAQAVAVKLV